MADTLDRSLNVSGPAIVTYRSQNFYSEGDISIDFDEAGLVDRNTSIYGITDKLMTDRIARVKFTPAACSEAALPYLFPFASLNCGDALFSGTDYPVAIQTTKGKLITLQSGAVTKAPSLNLNSKDSMIGEVEFTCIGKNNTSWSTASSFVAVTDSSWTDPATYNLAEVLNQVFTASWAASGAWSSFSSESGFKIEFDVKTQNLSNDAVGTYNVIFQELTVRCKCVPFPTGASPIAEAELVAALGWQGTGAGRGKSINALGSTYDLTITGAEATLQTPNRHLVFTLTKAALLSAGMRFGTVALRNGEFGFQATRKITGGTVSPLYSIALT